MRIAEDVTKLTGNTPPDWLQRVTDGAAAQVAAGARPDSAGAASGRPADGAEVWYEQDFSI
ncbi:MAG: hypothetical protein ACRDMI_18365 [Streptosporangiaceae bacterium]